MRGSFFPEMFGSIIRSCAWLLILLACHGGSAGALAQKADPQDPRNLEIGKELIEKSIAARGGTAYTQYLTLVATGQFTPYDKGLSQIPMPFVNYIVYPDRERVEFGKGKKKDRRIQVNQGKTGWVYDGDAETLKDQTNQQIADYLEGLEYDIDRILRGAWQSPEVKVRFAGREEIRPGERANVVALEFSSDRLIYLRLDRSTNLPLSLVYEKTGAGGLRKHEVRFFQYIKYDGVLFPNIVDFYRDGVQESRVNYQSVKIGGPLGDELFAKPASAKAIK